MMTPVHLTIVVPAFNEAARITSGLRQIIDYLDAYLDADLDHRGGSYEILAVDDGSTDETSSLVEAICRDAPYLRLLRNPTNSGKGFAVRTGVLEARGEYVFFTDADLSTPMTELERLLEPLQNGCDVAIGSRALKPEWVFPRQPWPRQAAGKMFNLVVRSATGLAFRDTQCGFKGFRRDAARAIFSRQTILTFGFDVEILYIARKLGLRSIEVPVHWANDTRTKVRPLRDGQRMLADLARIRWRDWSGKYES
jgi:glycosyltransferase involved in cell wall biosynthesis